MSDSSPTALRLKAAAKTTWTHVLRHTGVGIICAVAYFDPGNWSVDLQAGSEFGFKLLFVVLLSGLFAVFLQSLACKLGVVTGMNLAQHCRVLFYNRTSRPKLFRWLTLYPLYAFAEIAIISTDLAELLGSAIALNILFPKLPLWAGVLLTASDVFVILVFGDPLRGRPVKAFEILIGVLVITVLICMCIVISKVNVHWGEAFLGFVPSKTIFQSGGLYTSVGILGATVMPHSIFLGSALATQDRVEVKPLPVSDADRSSQVSDPSKTEKASVVFSGAAVRERRVFKGLWSRLVGYIKLDYVDDPHSHSECQNNTETFVKAHLRHGIVNLAISLLGIAVVINALILILAAAVFRDSSEATSSLFDAAELIGSTIGHGASIVFALALLCAGQSASIVATVAGQIVSEGYLRWRVSPMFRRLITRSLGLLPSMVVAIAAGRDGIDTMLVASQVILSIVLPFVIVPLVYLTSNKAIMRVRKDSGRGPASPAVSERQIESNDTDEYIDYSNSRLSIAVSSLIIAVVVLANAYVIVTLIIDGSG